MQSVLVGIAFIAILGSLAAALIFMMRRGDGDDVQDDERRSRRMARALAFRVGLSVLLFMLVLLSYLMGWIQPTGLPLSR